MRMLDAIGLTRKITRPRLRAFLQQYANEGRVLDVGCGAASYRDLFPQTTTLDIAARDGVKVDIIADAHDLSQIPDASFDIVLCTEVLEHLHTPERAIAEFRRVLKPQGLLLLSTRFIFPLHDVPGITIASRSMGFGICSRTFSDSGAHGRSFHRRDAGGPRAAYRFSVRDTWFPSVQDAVVPARGGTADGAGGSSRENAGDIRQQVPEKIS